MGEAAATKQTWGAGTGTWRKIWNQSWNSGAGCSGFHSVAKGAWYGGDTVNGKSKYYYPKEVTLSYDSIVTQNSVNKDGTIDDAVKKLYYTALGRERYCMYRQKLEIK